MRMGLLGSILVGLASAGWAAAQTPEGPNDSNGIPSNVTAFSGDGLVGNAFSTEPCCPSTCYWFNVDFLYYWLRDAPMPPLLTTVDPNVPIFEDSTGILGKYSTAIISGHQPVGLKDVLGARLSGGLWFDKEHTFGAEARYFGMEQVRNFVFEDSDLTGRPVLARPIINAQTGNETVFLTAFPDQFSGSIALTYQTHLFGAEANAIASPCNDGYFKFQEFLLGVRYVDLFEQLDVNQNSVLLTGGRGGILGVPVGPPAAYSLWDKFSAHNQFYGAQIGARGMIDCGMVYLRGSAKLAVGVNQREININGSTTFGTGAPGSTILASGGLLALGSNIGKYTSDTLAFVPEAEATFGVRLTKHININVGYNFLFMSNVARPGEAVDRIINPTLVPATTQFGPLVGAARPAFAFPQADFWAQGITVGLGLEY